MKAGDRVRLKYHGMDATAEVVGFVNYRYGPRALMSQKIHLKNLKIEPRYNGELTVDISRVEPA